MTNTEKHENISSLTRCINTFLDNKFGKNNTASKNNYRHYIMGFAESVSDVYPAVIDNPEQIFRNFQFDEIERSLDDYIIKKNRQAKHSNHRIEKMSIIIKYTYVVTEFFMYLSRKGWLNANLIARLYLDEEDNKSRQNMFNRIAKKHNLSNDVKSLEAISEDEAEYLLSICDRKILRAVDKLKISFEEYSYNVFLRNIVIELMILLGIKCSKITNIKYTDYDKETNRITLGNQKITLPPNLSQHFVIYDSYRMKINDKTSENDHNLFDQSLFVAFDGTFEAILNNKKKPIMISSSQYYKNALEGYPAYSSITPVTNRAIITMIKQRVDKNTIISVTGHGEKIYNNCVKLLERENPNFNILDETHLNRKLMKTSIYNMM